MNSTLAYYSEKAEEYSSSTFEADMKFAHERFLFYLPKTGKILDFGCGSGRDSVFFAQKGYEVTAADGCAEMAAIASANTGMDVKVMRFDELDAENEYAGIWACAAILHLPYGELKDVIAKMLRALQPQGSFYASFKLGDGEREEGGRHFTDMNVARLGELLLQFDNCLPLDVWISHDVRPGRFTEKWINVVARKTAEPVR